MEIIKKGFRNYFPVLRGKCELLNKKKSKVEQNNNFISYLPQIIFTNHSCLLGWHDYLITSKKFKQYFQERNTYSNQGLNSSTKTTYYTIIIT